MGVNIEEGDVTVFSGIGYWDWEGVDGGKIDSMFLCHLNFKNMYCSKKYVLFNLWLINNFFQKILC